MTFPWLVNRGDPRMILQVGCKLVVSFNPSEKYFSNWKSSPSMRQWTSGLAFQSALPLREPARGWWPMKLLVKVERPNSQALYGQMWATKKKRRLTFHWILLCFVGILISWFLFSIPDITGDRISSRKKNPKPTTRDSFVHVAHVGRMTCVEVMKWDLNNASISWKLKKLLFHGQSLQVPDVCFLS